MTTRKRPEQQLHRAVIDHLRLCAAPNVFYFHVPSGIYAGGKRTKDGTPIQAIIMKSLGWIAGLPDIMCIKDGKLYAIELKSLTGRLTSVQVSTISAMRNAGVEVSVAKNIDEALNVLEAWGMLRGRRM